MLDVHMFNNLQWSIVKEVENSGDKSALHEARATLLT